MSAQPPLPENPTTPSPAGRVSRYLLLLVYIGLAFAAGIWSSRALGIPLLLSTGMAGVAAFLAVLWLLPRWQTEGLPLEPKDRVELENSTRATLAQILGGSLFILTAYATWQNIDATQQNLKLSADKAINDRFAQAVELLNKTGSNTYNRIGGIYVLESISREAPQYYWPIMELLTAYVREHARPAGAAPARTKNAPDPITPELRAILQVLGRRISPPASLRPPVDQGVHLAGVYLPDASLNEADLHAVDLGGAFLSGAALHRANLRGAFLVSADLHGADLVGAHLENANFEAADLRDVNLDGAYLQNTSFRNANLSGAILSNAHLGQTDLSGADLTNVTGLTDEMRRQMIRR